MIGTYRSLDLGVVGMWSLVWMALGFLGWLAVVRTVAERRRLWLEDWLMVFPCVLLGPVAIFLAMRRWG
jgi:hypothetical protein